MNLYSEKLFSYGTLQYESVQLETFGRKLQGFQDVLSGYRLEPLKITDEKVIAISGEAIHQVLIPTNNITDEVVGIVFDITEEELKQADEYEVEDYKRVQVQLHSGNYSWVYVYAK